jgi:hypothetical protein
MSNQYLKLRRSAVPGKIPTTESIDFGEIALNTYDGLAFLKKSGSNGEEVVTIGTSNISTGSFVTTASFNSFTSSYTTGSFTGSFTGDGSGLSNLPVPSIDTGSLVTTASFNAFTASYNTSSFTGSFTGDGSGLINIPTQSFDTGSLVTTASFNAFTSSYNTGSFTGSFIGSLYGTASWALNAVTASYVSRSNTLQEVLEAGNTAQDKTIKLWNNNIDERYLQISPTILNITNEGSTYTTITNNEISINNENTNAYFYVDVSNAATETLYVSGNVLISGNLNTTGSNTFIGTQFISGSIYQNGDYYTQENIVDTTQLINLGGYEQNYVGYDYYFNDLGGTISSTTESLSITGVGDIFNGVDFTLVPLSFTTLTLTDNVNSLTLTDQITFPFEIDSTSYDVGSDTTTCFYATPLNPSYYNLVVNHGQVVLSSSLYLPNIETASFHNIVSVDTNTGKLYNATSLPAGGNSTEIQYNNGGTLAGISSLKWDAGNKRLNLNQGYYVMEFPLNSGGGFLGKQQGGDDLFQFGFNTQGRYGGTPGTLSGNQIFVWNSQENISTYETYYWGFNNTGDNYWGSSNILYSLKAQQPRSGSVPLSILGRSDQVANLFQISKASGSEGQILTVSASGDIRIGNKLTVTGSLIAPTITGSLQGTASWANNAISASQTISSSYATTASNILGGKATHIPFFVTDTTLATSSLYQSGSSTVIINKDNATAANPEALYVWQSNPTSINVISGKGNLNSYLQLNIQNTNQGTNASSDVVATAGNGDENGNYIDMGINSDNFNGFLGGPNDAYLYATGSHLHIGNATPDKPIQFFVGGTDTETNRKLELNADGKHNVTGSLTVTQGITASLYGTATNAITASYAATASYVVTANTASYVAGANVKGLVASASYAVEANHAQTSDYATTAGNGGVTQLIAGSGVTLIPSTGLGNVTIVTTGGGGTTIISGSNVTGSFLSNTTWTFNHDLGTRTPIITVFDTNYNQIIPENIELTSTSSATITFPTAESGFAIASLGGSTGTALSSSYSLYSTYASTASYYVETDPVFVAKSGSFATTGSNRFIGNQTITGSTTSTLGFTGSLFGTASWANNALTASYITASNVIGILPVTNGGTGVTSSSGANSVVLRDANQNISVNNINAGTTTQVTTDQTISLSVSSSFVQVATGTTNNIFFNLPNSTTLPIGASYQFNNNTTSGYIGVRNYTVSNTLSTIPAGGAVQVILISNSSTDGTWDVLNYTPKNISWGTDALTATNTAASFSKLTVTAGVTGSLFGTASWANNALTASYVRPLVQDVIITGSLKVSGSNTLIGGTVLSGSINISGSTTLNGSTSFYGTHTLSGSNTIIGNTTLSGSFEVSGSTILHNSIFIVTGSTYIKGVTAISGSTQITGSLNVVDGDINVVSGSSFTRWGNKLFNYGQFSSTETQSGSADTAYAMKFNTTDFASGVSMVSNGSGLTRITVANTGIYNLQFSAQLGNTANSTIDFDIWFAYTGSNIANSNTQLTISKTPGSVGRLVAAWNFMTPITAGDYLEIIWSCTAGTGQLQAVGTQTVPTRPAIPSVIATLTQIA